MPSLKKSNFGTGASLFGEASSRHNLSRLKCQPRQGSAPLHKKIRSLSLHFLVNLTSRHLSKACFFPNYAPKARQTGAVSMRLAFSRVMAGENIRYLRISNENYNFNANRIFRSISNKIIIKKILKRNFNRNKTNYK